MTATRIFPCDLEFFLLGGGGAVCVGWHNLSRSLFMAKQERPLLPNHCLIYQCLLYPPCVIPKSVFCVSSKNLLSVSWILLVSVLSFNRAL